MAEWSRRYNRLAAHARAISGHGDLLEAGPSNALIRLRGGSTSLQQVVHSQGLKDPP